MNKPFAWAILLALISATCAHAAQQPSLPRPPPIVMLGTPDIPTDSWVYDDLRRLQDRKRFGQYPDRSNGLWAYTRQEFAILIASQLPTLGSAFDKEVQQDPELLNALHRLVQEFAPELERNSVPLVVIRSRISMLARARDKAKATGPFSDVPEGHWAYQAVETLRQTGILIGYPGRTFTTRSR